MNVNRPRHSVLSLFDPLSASTPDADKENLPSPSVFLNQQSNPPVALPKKRLVDIGDTTLDNVSTLDVPTEEQDALLKQGSDVNDVQPCLETPPPRAPLAELTPSTEKTPPQPSTSPLLLSLITPAQDFGHPSFHDAVSGEDNMTPGNVLVPQIVISYNSVDNSPEKSPQRASHDNTTTSLTDSPSNEKEEQTAPPNLHLRAPSTVSQENRFSLDLQASFQMYLQSEASFDLLNDKIAFIEPTESQTTDDEGFDFELDKDNLQDALAKLKRGRKSDVSPSSLAQDFNESSLSHSSVRDDNAFDLPTSPSNDALLLQRIPSSPLSSSSDKSSKRWSTSSGIPSPTPRAHRGSKESSRMPAKAVSSARPESKQRRFSTPVATPQRMPAIVPPPAIQALRIVKRTKLSRTKAESSSDATSTTTSPCETERSPSSLAGTRHATSKHPETQPLRIQPPSFTKLAKATPSTSAASAGLGPRRITITTDNQVAVPKPSQRSLVNAMLGPKRILISNDGSNPSLSKPSSIPSGPKQPKRFESGSSNLPRPSGMAVGPPTSRLPTPISGPQSKLRWPVAGIGKGSFSRVVSGD